MIRLSELLTDFFYEEESDAAQQAKQQGLVYKGFGRWADPKTGTITHKTDGGRLVPVGTGTGGTGPAAPGDIGTKPKPTDATRTGHPDWSRMDDPDPNGPVGKPYPEPEHDPEIAIAKQYGNDWQEKRPDIFNVAKAFDSEDWEDALQDTEVRKDLANMPPEDLEWVAALTGVPYDDIEQYQQATQKHDKIMKKKKKSYMDYEPDDDRKDMRGIDNPDFNPRNPHDLPPGTYVAGKGTWDGRRWRNSEFDD